MVRRHYFEHVSPGGTTPSDRMRAAGYGSGAFSSGENIAYYAPASAASARVIHRMWMHSKGHRHNILRRSWRDLGVGVASGSPTGGSGRVVVAMFGRR